LPTWLGLLDCWGVGAKGWPCIRAVTTRAWSVFHGADEAEVTRVSWSFGVGPYSLLTLMIEGAVVVGCVFVVPRVVAVWVAPFVLGAEEVAGLVLAVLVLDEPLVIVTVRTVRTR
jgi:hypothetical protein